MTLRIVLTLLLIIGAVTSYYMVQPGLAIGFAVLAFFAGMFALTKHLESSPD